MSNMKNILVTGSSGYIGQHLMKMLNGMPDIKAWGLDYDVSDIEPIYWDIRYKLENYIFDFEDYPIEYDAIIHLAALVRVGESMREPIRYYDTNVDGTLNILRGIETSNFIFASTGAAQAPTSPYAISKRMAEDVIYEYCTKSGIDFTSFRFYNVTGSDVVGPTNPDGLLFNLIQACETKEFNIWGNDYNTKDGTCVREYVHVNDICRALIKAIDEPANDIENLAYGDTRTVKEIAEIFKQVNNVDFDIKYRGRREGDAEAYYLKNPSSYMQRNYTYEQMFKV